MADLAPFPDIFLVLRASLTDLCPNIAEATPPDPNGTLTWLPFVTIEIIGGQDDRVTDTSRATVQTFASTKADASALAESIRQRLISGPIVTTAGTVDVGATTSRPFYLDYVPNPPPYRYTATYSVAQRRK